MDEKEVAIWMSYDLGVGGDFEGLYAWLDDHGAIECGNNVAYFKYKPTFDTDKELANSLKKDLSEKVKFAPTNRIYIVRRTEKGKSIGTFIVGKRKASPWEGFGTKTNNTIDE
ncbi:hypothetical protein AGMMS49965_21390 [Bacteroidia bacterium]|nr:hypothetical protein AGMMS49965_21390 [Bacteroidia bacterium]